MELQAAADTLRGHVTSDAPAPDFPMQYTLMSVARLLEELSRGLAAGHPPPEHATDAALEIARHLRHWR